MSEPQSKFLVRIENEDALVRVLGFCDRHGSLDLQGLVDGIVGGSIVVLPLSNAIERQNAAKVHGALLAVIDSTYPTLYPLVQRISAAYRLAEALASSSTNSVSGRTDN